MKKIERHTIFQSLHGGLDSLGTLDEPILLLEAPQEGLTIFSLRGWIDLPDQSFSLIPQEILEDSEESYNQRLAINERENANHILVFSLWNPSFGQWLPWLSFALLNRGAPQVPDYFADIQNTQSSFNFGPGFKLAVSLQSKDGSSLGERDIINIYGDAATEVSESSAVSEGQSSISLVPAETRLTAIEESLAVISENLRGIFPGFIEAVAGELPEGTEYKKPILTVQSKTMQIRTDDVSYVNPFADRSSHGRQIGQPERNYSTGWFLDIARDDLSTDGSQSFRLFDNRQISLLENIPLAGPFTIQGWFYTDHYDGAGRDFVMFDWNTGNTNGLRLEFDADDPATMRLHQHGVGDIMCHRNLHTNFRDAQWHHFALTRDEHGIMMMWLDGQFMQAIKEPYPFSTATNFQFFGRHNDGSFGNLNGWFNGLEIATTCRYTQAMQSPGFAPAKIVAPVPQTEFLLQNDKDIQQYATSGDNRPLVFRNTAKLYFLETEAARAILGTYALRHDGDNNGWITLTQSADYVANQNDFDFEYSFYQVNGDHSYHIACNNLSTTYGRFMFGYGSSQNTAHLVFWAGGPGDWDLASELLISAHLPKNQMHRIRLQRRGETLTFFVGGVQVQALTIPEDFVWSLDFNDLVLFGHDTSGGQFGTQNQVIFIKDVDFTIHPISTRPQ